MSTDENSRSDAPAAVATQNPVKVNPAAFESLMSSEATPPAPKGENHQNIDLILDVDVTVTACIGNVRRSIGDILSLTEGQVIDMERSSGEPVDLLVNGRLIAKGEVVVVEERYGIRITQIVAKEERITK